MKKIIITGASGFWGYNFLDFIYKKNEYDITCIYNTNSEPLKDFDVKKIQCNLENKTELDKLEDDYDIIVHLASVIKHTKKNSFQNIGINVNSTKNIFNLAYGISVKKKIKVICASTIGTVACFENDNEFANENSGFSTKSFSFPYYYSKILIEQMGDTYRNNNLDIVFIRPPVIYGEKDIKGRAISRIKKFLNSNLVLYTRGNIPFCDVKDVVQITYDIANNPNPYQKYNIDGHQISIRKFYETLEKLSGERKIKIYIPYYVGKILIPILKNFIKVPDIIEFYMGNSYWNSDSIHLKNYKFIDYQKTLNDTIKYIKDTNVINRENNSNNYKYLLLGIGMLFPLLLNY
jgi:dihydroflavonol-4-reductase